jgi:SEC-C motif-containing protein
MSEKSIPCPCGRQHQKQTLSFEKCCARYLDHYAEHPAPDAESLMRSRYSAFVLEREDYLKATWSALQCPSTIEFEAGVKWLGLDVKRHRQIDPEHAEVEFVARSRHNGRASRLHEMSRFVKQDGRWVYVDGTLL